MSSDSGIEFDPEYRIRDSRKGLIFGIAVMLAGVLAAGVFFWLVMLPRL
jgi:hypothetical protein